MHDEKLVITGKTFNFKDQNMQCDLHIDKNLKLSVERSKEEKTFLNNL